MGFSPFVLAGEYILFAANLIGLLSWYLYLGIIVVVGGLVVARYLTDALHLNPFSRVVYHLARPAGVLLSSMRNSNLYYPLRKALKFDPAVLMLLIATALVCYAISLVVNYLLILMTGLGRCLIAFGSGYTSDGVRYLIGTLLLAAIFYLLWLMLVVFVNWLFGLFSKTAFRARQRVAPLLRFFDRGPFRGWSFLILGIALSIAAAAIQMVFLT